MSAGFSVPLTARYIAFEMRLLLGPRVVDVPAVKPATLGSSDNAAPEECRVSVYGTIEGPGTDA